MDQKLFSKLNLYDQIGFILVGVIGVLIIFFDAFYFYGAALPVYNLELLPLWLVLSYFLGHIIQGTSNFITDLPLLNSLISERKKEFKEDEKEILNKARQYFNVKKQDLSFIWNLCYVFALAKDVTGHVEIFNANYSLYRGWFTIFLIESVFLVFIFFRESNFKNLIFLLISILISAVLYRRAHRFWSYTRSKVLQTFIVVKTLNL